MKQIPNTSEIPDTFDVTQFYLAQVLKGKAPQLAELHRNFESINIDRVFQSYVDLLLKPERALEGPQQAAFESGKAFMAKFIKKFICNLATLSMTVDGHLQAGQQEEDISELLQETVISTQDLVMADRLERGLPAHPEEKETAAKDTLKE